MRIRFGYPTKRTRRNSGYFQGHTSILSITLYLLIYQRLDWTSSITNLRTAFKGPNCYFFLAVNGRGFQVWENKLHHQGLHSSAARWDDQLDGGHFLCGGRPGPKRAQATWRWLAEGLLFQFFLCCGLHFMHVFVWYHMFPELFNIPYWDCSDTLKAPFYEGL